MGIERVNHCVSAGESHFYFWGCGVSGGVDNPKSDARPIRSGKISQTEEDPDAKKPQSALSGAEGLELRLSLQSYILDLYLHREYLLLLRASQYPYTFLQAL